jgi:hypothetical protein
MQVVVPGSDAIEGASVQSAMQQWAPRGAGYEEAEAT